MFYSRSITAVDNPVPLIVDLDGTLTPTDATIESLLRVVRSRLFGFLAVIGWLFRGRAVAKALAARLAPPDVTALPLNPGVLSVIQAARSEGRQIILATASHQRIATRIAKATGLFDIAIGSTGRRHVKGVGKLNALRSIIGSGPFDYIGDSPADVPIWRAARTAYSCRYRSSALDIVPVSNVISGNVGAVIRALRPHQWVKNILVFVPVATAGLLLNTQIMLDATLAAILFSLVASGLYQINDLLDIDADRAHAKKRKRPIAAGRLSVVHALLLAVLLITIAFAGALAAFSPRFAGVLLFYMILTTAYSIRLKAVVTLDVITLGCLYTLRIAAGAVAANIVVSSWLLLFSIFFFLSLGYLKRVTELRSAHDPTRLLKGRGYIGGDLPVVAMAGIAAGMVSILVMALFITQQKATGDYASPLMLWGIFLCLLYWINRVWIMAYRDQIDCDPVAFAVRDGRSIVVAVLAGMFMILAQSVRIPGFTL